MQGTRASSPLSLHPRPWMLRSRGRAPKCRRHSGPGVPPRRAVHWSAGSLLDPGQALPRSLGFLRCEMRLRKRAQNPLTKKLGPNATQNSYSFRAEKGHKLLTCLCPVQYPRGWVFSKYSLTASEGQSFPLRPSGSHTSHFPPPPPLTLDRSPYLLPSGEIQMPKLCLLMCKSSSFSHDSPLFLKMFLLKYI